MAGDASRHEETADEYARLERCLRDHRRAPFRFLDHICSLQATRLPEGPQGIVAETGLSAMSFPRSRIDQDTMPDVDCDPELLSLSPADGSLSSPPLGTTFAALQHLRLPAAALDVGSNVALDLEDYIGQVKDKAQCRIGDQWLPLSPVKADSDEGLLFPSRCDKLRLLIRRELRRESITKSAQASLLEQEALNPIFTVESEPQPAKHQVKAEQNFTQHRAPFLTRLSIQVLDPITPPLSPISDDSYFPLIPDESAAVIDLTSDPGSPNDPSYSTLQQLVHHETLESVSSPCLRVEPPVECLPQLFVSQDLKLDAPLSMISSDSQYEDDPFTGHTALFRVDVESETPLENPNHFFDEAMEAVLEDRGTYVSNLVEQEHLDPCDSTSRVPVPRLDFKVEKPEWTMHVCSISYQFKWLRGKDPDRFRLPLAAQDTRLESSLKWTPVPSDSRHFSTHEEISRSKFDQFLADEVDPRFAFISIPDASTALAILRDVDGEALELSDEACSETDDQQAHIAVPVPGNSIQSDKPDLEIERVKKSRRIPTCEASNILPGLGDLGATCKLLSGFMDLRAVKRRRTVASSQPATPPAISAPIAENRPANMEVDEASNREAPPAPAPSAVVPPTPGAFIVSVSLGRSLLNHLDKLWPREHLIDQDLSRFNTLSWSPRTVQPRTIASPPAYDADIWLTPSQGLIVTSLLQAKQRALPGSKVQTSLRERVQKVSAKYDNLIVLVSETNPTGEVCGEQTTTDMAAYADFVRFTIGLENKVTVYYVPGGQMTLSKWIVALLSHCSPPSPPMKQYLSPRETTWDVFFRRCGVNMGAAQRLSGFLAEEAGKEGLAIFGTLSGEERLYRGAEIVEKGGIVRLNQALGQSWE